VFKDIFECEILQKGDPKINRAPIPYLSTAFDSIGMSGVIFLCESNKSPICEFQTHQICA